jgi:small subunit ribosomal protein S4
VKTFCKSLSLDLIALSYRMGFSASRGEARQAVRHNSPFKVNGRRVNIPSYQVKPGDVIEVSGKIQESQLRIKAAVEAADRDVVSRNGLMSMRKT